MTDDKDRERRIELLVGRHVYDKRGRRIGHIEELRAKKERDYYVLTEIDIGPVALLERLAVRHFGITWLGRPHGYRARWDQIDLEDERRPTLTCGVEDLEVLGAPRARHRTR